MSDWKTVVPNSVDSETWDRQGTIQGVYATKKENVGPNGSTMYILKTKDKDISVWGSAVLDSRFELIEIGNEVRITGLGKVKSPSTNREYYDYQVEVRSVPFEEVGEPSKNAPTKDVVIEDVEDEVDLSEIPF